MNLIMKKSLALFMFILLVIPTLSLAEPVDEQVELAEEIVIGEDDGITLKDKDSEEAALTIEGLEELQDALVLEPVDEQVELAEEIVIGEDDGITLKDKDSEEAALTIEGLEELQDALVLEEPDVLDLASELEIDTPSTVLSNDISTQTVLGVWTGTFDAEGNDGIEKRPVRVDIDYLSENYMEGIVTLEGGEGGRYYVTGAADIFTGTGNIAFRGTDWIENPKDYGFTSFSGVLNENDNTIQGFVDESDTRSFLLHKESDTPVTGRIDLQSVPRNWKGEYEGYNDYRGASSIPRDIEIRIQDIQRNGNIKGVALVTPSQKADRGLGFYSSFKFSGEINASHRTFRMEGTDWICYPVSPDPVSWGFPNLEGTFDTSLTTITGSDWEAHATEPSEPAFPIEIGNNHHVTGKFYSTLDQYILDMDSEKYHPELAYMLASLAGAAYNKTGKQSGELTIENAGYRSKSKELEYITKAYEDLGFIDYQPYNYYNDPSDPAYGSNNAAFMIGEKLLGNGETLVLIVVRGSYGKLQKLTSDWQSDLIITTDWDKRHLGFSSAAEKLLSQINEFLYSRFNHDTVKHNIRFVITGHSRGGGVANLLAVKLQGYGIPKSRIYNYNFACPDTVQGFALADRRKGHENIFNINNSADAVGVIPGVAGDALKMIKQDYRDMFKTWGKYGTTLFYCKDWNNPAEFDLTRTLDTDNSPHDYKFYIEDMSKKPTSFYTWSDIAARRIQLGAGDGGMAQIIKTYYPDYAAEEKISLSKAKVTVKDQVYTGKALAPAVKVVLKKKVLKKDTDYKVAFKHNKNIGTATVTVEGTGKYTGKVKKEFKINPKSVTGFKLTAGQGKITAEWKKSENVTGYRLQYSLKKNFSSANTVKINKADTLRTVLKKLKGGSTYYVRIQAYKTVGIKAKTYYSAWSSAKTATVLK